MYISYRMAEYVLGGMVTDVIQTATCGVCSTPHPVSMTHEPAYAGSMHSRHCSVLPGTLSTHRHFLITFNTSDTILRDQTRWPNELSVRLLFWYIKY